MYTLPTANYQEIDASSVPPVQLAGKHCVITPTLFGPVDRPYLVSTVDQLKQQFGGPDSVMSPYFAQLRRAIARGTSMWIQRLVGNAAALAAHVFVTNDVTITSLWLGAFANGNLGIQYTPSADGVKPVLTVVYTPNTLLNETFTADTFADLIALVNANSNWIQISTTVGFTELAAVNPTTFLAGGSDGTFANQAATDTAYTAALAKFNNITDMDTIVGLGDHSLTWMENMLNWAATREDVLALFEIDPTLSPTAALAFMATVPAATAIQGSFLAIYYGSLLTAYSSEASALAAGPIICDVQSVFANSDTVTGNRYRAPAGAQRGLIPYVQSFAANLLSPANKVIAQQLAALGCNIVGSHPVFGPVVWGANTMNRGNTSLDAIHVRRMLIDLHQQLSPIFQGTLFDPMDPTTWRSAYGKALPLLQKLEADRAIYPGWTYIGDQESSTVQSAVYNQADDLANGIYKVKILLVATGYIGTIEFAVEVDSINSLFQTTAA